jgi:hypothetical protein
MRCPLAPHANTLPACKKIANVAKAMMRMVCPPENLSFKYQDSVAGKSAVWEKYQSAKQKRRRVFQHDAVF